MQQDQTNSVDSFKDLAEGLPQLVWTCRPDGYCDYLSRQWVEYTGRPEDQQLGSAWMEFVHPEDRQRLAEAWAAAVRHRGTYDIEFRIRRFDGVYRWFKTRAIPFKDESGHVIKWVGSNTDIEDLRAAQQALRNSEARLQSLVETLSEGLITADLEGNLLHWNRAAMEMHGYTSLDDVRRHLGEFTAIFQLEELDGRLVPFEQWPMRRILRGEVLRDWQLRLVRKEGDWSRVYSYGGALVRDVHDQPMLAMLTVMDSTERHAAAQRIRESEEQFRALVQVTSQIVWTTNADGLIVEDSPSWRAFTGQTYEQWKGEGWLNAVHPDDRALALAAWTQAVRGKVPYRVEYRLRHVSGGYRWTLASAVQLKNPDGSVRSWVGMCSDITEHMEAQISLRRAKETAEAASRAKDHFLAVVSHELRTPLTPVLAAATHLRNASELPATLRDDVEMICRNVEMESRLVNDLLSLTRLARGKIVLHQETVDAHALIRDVASQFQPEFEIKHVDLQLDLKATEPYLWADPMRLRQVVGNLLSNAEKFTPEGGKVIVRTGLDQRRFRIEVSDNGVGIEPDVMPRLFNPFEQGEQTITRKFGGLGLGLSIARQLVELHGGTLRAGSAGRDQGATFTIELAAAAFISSTPPAAARVVASTSPASRATILLVEDHPDTLRTMARLLQHLGHQVETASTVAEALAKAEDRSFDVLLSDIGLPDGSGLDVVRELRRRGSIRHAVALSGFGQAEDMERSMEAGFTEHLVKPVDVMRLREAIMRAPAG